MTHYSQGVAGDGPCILMDGMPLTPEQIVNSLNHKTHAIKRLTELLEQHAPGIFDDNNETGPKIVDEEELIKTMVDRFLCWKLPETFSPDAGIAFTEPSKLYPHMECTEHMWPTGTNLLDAEQAEQMVRHMLGLSN